MTMFFLILSGPRSLIVLRGKQFSRNMLLEEGQWCAKYFRTGLLGGGKEALFVASASFHGINISTITNFNFSMSHHRTGCWGIYASQLLLADTSWYSVQVQHTTGGPSPVCVTSYLVPLNSS